jgi:hypothetical protein
VCVLRPFTCARGYVSLSRSLARSLFLALFSLSLSLSLSLARALSLSRSLCGIALQEDVAEYDRKEGERVPNSTHASETRLD